MRGASEGPRGVQRKRLPHPGAGTARLPQVSIRACWYGEWPHIGTSEWLCRLIQRMAVQVGIVEWLCRLVRASGCAEWYSLVAVQIDTKNGCAVWYS